MSSEREVEIEALTIRASRIEFVTLVEHLEHLFGEHPAVGTAARVEDEPLRFRHDASLIFHSSDVVRLRFLASGRYELTTTFLGATGSVSPLATFFTEDLLRADAQDGAQLGAFYDLFHHRLLALFYRAKQRGRPAFRRSALGTDATTRRAAAFVGLPAARSHEPVSPTKLLGRARTFATRPGSLPALQSALDLAFPGIPIHLVDFVPRPMQVGASHRLRVGRSNHQLGHSARLGRSLTGPAEALRICVGPVDRATFDAFLVGGIEHTRVRELVDQVSGGLHHFELELATHPGEELRAQLGGGGSRATALGRDALVRRTSTTTPLRVRVPLSSPEERLQLA